jgi:hypothetical protein
MATNAHCASAKAEQKARDEMPNRQAVDLPLKDLAEDIPKTPLWFIEPAPDCSTRDYVMRNHL